MLRMFAHRMFQVSTGVGTDEAIFGVALPSDSVLHRVQGQVGVAGTTPQSIATASAYAVGAYILPILDPDAAISIDTLWDTLVPKDTDVQAIDLDTAAGDTTPFYEPGEADWSDLLDVGLRPEKIFNREVLMGPSSHALSIDRDPESPFAYEWLPGDFFKVDISKGYRVKQPSMVVMAFASPSLDDTSATVPVGPLEGEWPRIKYAGQMLEQALMDLFGLTEVAGDEPWQGATDVLQKHLMPDIYEQSSGFFLGTTLQCWGKMVIDHSVEGHMGVGSISLS